MEIRSMNSFLPYLESIRERTMRVLRTIPDEKLEWRHSEGVFSAGDLARHIAAVERYTFAENALGRQSRYKGCGIELASGRDNVIAVMEDMHAETIAMIKDLTPDDLLAKAVSPQGVPVTRWKLLRAMVEHEVHHRGEMYVYLALLGIERPPLYGTTEPELRKLSVAS